jgi:gluconate kinase
MAEQLRDQAVELFAAVRAREHFVHCRGHTRRVAHRLGARRERLVPELAVRSETRELEQTGPSQAIAPERASTLRPPMIRTARTYVRSESVRRGPMV